jgi:hypothetical protein
VALVVVGWTAFASGDSHPPAIQPTRANPSVDCDLANRRPSPRRVVAWMAAHGLEVAVAKAPASLPATACGSEAFTDARAGGTNAVVSYPNADAAARAADGQSFAEGIYVVTLVRGLDPAQYRQKLAEYVAATNPPIQTPGHD